MKLCCCFLIIAVLRFTVGRKEFHKGRYSRTEMSLVSAKNKFGLIEGSFMIGALFPIHEQPLMFGNSNPLLCGNISDLYGIQRVEAAFYTIDLINNDLTLLPHIKLGIEIRDECWSTPVALDQTLKLIYKSVDHYTPCESNGSILYDSITAPLIGLIGPAGSSVAIGVQNLLQLFGIPQIGYSTTSEDFTDKKSYRYFLQLVPPDRYQVQAIIDVLNYFNWTYVNAIYTNEYYGRGGIKTLKSLLPTSEICLAVEESALINDDPGRYDEIVSKLYNEEKANVIICFCEGLTVQGLLSAIKRSSHNNKNRFIFIGSDGWAGRNDIVRNLEEYAVGSIMIKIYSPRVENFDDYYLKLKPIKNERNPWFIEFWQHQFNCSFRHKNNSQLPLCTGKEEWKENYMQDPKLSLVIKSIYTYAHALHDMSNALCGPNSSPCEKLLSFNTTLFWDYVMNVSFSYRNETVKYTKNGTNSVHRYNILTYRLMSTGNYGYVEIGSWINNILTINDKLKLFTSGIKSVCSEPCKPGFEKKFQDKMCCWYCIPCPIDAISDGNNCTRCPYGYHPSKNKTMCKETKPKYIKFSDIQAVISLSISTVGIGATVFVLIVFLLYNNTPVVKSSTKELSYIMLTGMCLSHCIAFPMIARPTDLTCTVGRILPGFSFATIYAPLLLKTNRISRILTRSKENFMKRNLRFVTATEQLYISTALIGIELVICIWMLIVEPAKATMIKQSDQLILTCDTSISGLIVPLMFNGFLVLMCTMYAFKTRSVPRNFNEAKFIGFSMYATCLTWIAFGLIYFNSTLKVSIACICISTNALVILVFLFFPKVYIILFRPEKNNRTHFVTTKGLRMHFGNVPSHFREQRSFLKNSTNSSQLQIPSIYTELQQVNDERKKIRFRSIDCQTDPDM